MLAVNFYFGAAAVGVLAALYTTEQGPIPQTAAFGLLALTLLACLGYQVFRAAFRFRSPGEAVLSNTSKKDLTIQEKLFSISRTPLFVLLLLTLALPGNFLNGIGDEQVYNLAQCFTIGLLYLSFYRGLHFFSQPSFLASAMFAGGLLLSITMAYGLGPAGAAVSALLLGLAGLWLIAWLVYRRYYLPSENS